MIRILEQMLDYYNKSEEELNHLIPSYIRNSFRDTIFKSYIQDESIIKKILFFIFKDSIYKAQLKTHWLNYVKRHQFKIKEKESITEEKEINKIKPIQQKDIKKMESQLKDLFPELISKIEWYLQRNFLPTEKIILNDFSKNKKDIEKIIELTKLGIQSFENLIILQTQDELYLLSKSYLKKNKENLLKKYQTKLEEMKGVETKDGKVLALKSDMHNKELYQKLINLLNSL